ncbi:MAG: hypothetical protein LUE26_01140 [Alistipes sp.]|nr:hypothetical protein [Alistipes sp.]
MRIFYYITTSTSTSTNLQNSIFLTSNSSRLFNYLQNDLVLDPTESVMNFHELQSLQIAEGNWYMMEYEINYDPNITSYTTSQISWGFELKYYDIAKINLTGEGQSEISGYIGAKSNSNIFSSLTNTAEIAGSGVIAASGMRFLEKNPTVFSDSIYKKVYEGVQSAVKSSAQNLPGAAMKILSAIVGGSSGPTPISMKMNTEFTIEGESTQSGSLRGASMMIPGTQVSSSYTWYIPFYNKPLGVFTLRETPSIPIQIIYENNSYPDDMYGNDMFYVTYTQISLPQTIDYSSYIIVNPELTSVADFNIIAQELVMINERTEVYVEEGVTKNRKVEDATIEPARNYNYQDMNINTGQFPEPHKLSFKYLGVRFNIEIKPKDGSPSSMIYKTFRLNPEETIIKR